STMPSGSANPLNTAGSTLGRISPDGGSGAVSSSAFRGALSTTSPIGPDQLTDRRKPWDGVPLGSCRSWPPSGSRPNNRLEFPGSTSTNRFVGASWARCLGRSEAVVEWPLGFLRFGFTSGATQGDFGCSIG